eukprot:GFUD01006844.1.p1 GENE.GFUD01006844.1~~GFUD01006844.1.p1  ORF type:complete len:809 (+),score=174.80 GFUD01006844.1:161-2587(+)
MNTLVNNPEEGGANQHPDQDTNTTKWRVKKHNSIKKVKEWKCSQADTTGPGPGMAQVSRRPLFRGRTPSYEALKGAVTDLYRLDDFESEKLGAGFFSEVFKVTHKTTGKVLVLKMNKHRSNSMNSLKEIQLMNKLKHPNILQFEAVCVHEGQLHALTEYIDGGTLEELIQDLTINISWAQRMEIGLHIAQGLLYLNSKGMFHRDLTSKNIFLRKNVEKVFAIVGDFGLATKIPKKTDSRLPQVGSPYWMSPECLKGEFYDKQADIFSLGIIMCELIARVDADPDILPRTQNFGVEYKAFSDLCPSCPPDFLKVTFTCVSIDPDSRPTAADLIRDFKQLYQQQKISEDVEKNKTTTSGPLSLNTEMETLHNKKVALKRFLSEGEGVMRKSPSDKARLHHKSLPSQSAKTVGEEMCLTDPYYQPPPGDFACLNPFATLPRLREGRKIIGSTSELFSSCFELPSPRVSSPTDTPPSYNTRSLPSSPPNNHREIIEIFPDLDQFAGPSCSTPAYKYSFHEHPSRNNQTGQNRKKLSSSRECVSQDDSLLGMWSGVSLFPFPLRRCGSYESGFYSSSTDDYMWDGGMLSNRSIGSSLLTVSDLEEDLRAASALLSKKRTSSVFTDSLDDLSYRLDDISSIGFTRGEFDLGDSKPEKYEKDIRDIVEYFERNCHINTRVACKSEGETHKIEHRMSPEIVRSQKIESLIKKVAENKSRARFCRRPAPPQHLQVCDGIVRSKLPLFDQTKRQVRGRLPADQHGFVKARLAMFDKPKPKTRRKLVSDFLLPNVVINAPKKLHELQNQQNNAENSCKD